jgi:hypothetical protein
MVNASKITISYARNPQDLRSDLRLLKIVDSEARGIDSGTVSPESRGNLTWRGAGRGG